MCQQPCHSAWNEGRHVNLLRALRSPVGGLTSALILRNLTVLLAVLLVSLACASSKVSSLGAEQMERSPAPKVWLEADSTIRVTAREVAPNTHPFHLNSFELADFLRGISVSSGRGFLKHLSPQPAFSDKEVKLVSPLITEALGRASRWERVVFKLERAESDGGETSGALFIRGSYLHFVLAKHRVFNREDPEGAATREHRIFFDRDSYRAPPGGASLVEWSESDLTHISIDHQRLRAELKVVADAQKPVVPSVQQTTVPTFQQQVQELTESNLELRDKLKTLQQDLDRNRQQGERLSLELDQAKHALREKGAALKQLQEQGKPSKEQKRRTSEAVPSDSQHQ